MKLKTLFTTPKRAIITSVCMLAILAAAGTATALAAESIAKSNSIGTAAAEEKALLDAGVSSADANFGYTDFDFEKGSFVYEVEFTANGIEWEYVIKASDGTVLSRRAKVQQGYADAGTPGMDTVDTSAPVSEESDAAADVSTPETSTPETSTPVQEETDIGLEAAKNAALADAGVNAADATFTEQKRDREDGVLVYDIEFYTSTTEYEYEIDASTGAVREKKAESKTQTGDNGAYIGLERAKEIALSHAGLSAGEVYLSKAKFEDDDGVKVYEIEFYKDRMEYEYTIHAATGRILEFDAEYDD